MTLQSTTSNPFVGLRPFESEEDFLFFGREKQALELLQRLHQHHFVAVIGSSGSGKSSLIKAGLIPGLQAGYLVNDRDRWLIASMKPGQDPLFNLAGTVLEQLKDTTGGLTARDLVQKIKEEGVDAFLDILKPLAKDKINFFLLVDQFEELFRFSLDQQGAKNKDEATDFVNILLELSEQKNLPVYVVITMRSDFIGDCTQFFGFPEALNESQYLVPRLNRTQLKTTIEGPVRLYKGKITPGLTARLLNDSQIVKDELPLLQHALMRTWDYELHIDKNGELDINDYENIGGIEKALSNHADEALAGMSAVELLLTKKIFQALTTVDENGRKIRRPVRLSELEAITGTGKDQLLALINRFIEGNRSFLIINKSGEEKDWLVDISHESLIRQWSTLSGWVDEEAESAKVYDRLIESASLFREKKKDLMTGSELQLSLQWYKEFKPVPVWAQRYNPGFEGGIHYLQESEKEWQVTERKKKKRSRNQLILIASFVALIIFVLFFYGKERAALAESNAMQAKRFKEQAYLADSLRGVAVKASQEAEKQRDIAIYNVGVALLQEKRADSSAAEAQKQKLAAQLAENEALRQKNAAVAARKIARSEKLQTEVQKEAFRLIIVATQKVSENPTVALRIAEEAMHRYPDKLIIKEASQIYDENVFYKTVVKDSFPIASLNFSTDGTKALAFPALNDETNYSISAKTWNLHGKESTVFRFPGTTLFSILKMAVMSANGSDVLTAIGDSAILWNMYGKKMMSFKDSTSINDIAVSYDGTKVLTNSEDRTILWNIDGRKIRTIKNTDANRSVAISPDNIKILTASARTDSTRLKLWDEQGKQTGMFMLKGEINSVVFSPDSKKVLTYSNDSTVTLIDLDSNIQRNIKLPGKILSAIFSRDGTKILTALDDNTARLWNYNDSSLVIFRGHTGAVTSLTFSPDDKTILTGSADKTAILWDEHGTQLQVLKGHTQKILSVAFSPDATKIFTGSEDSTIRAWNVASAFHGHTNTINLVAFSPDGTKILTGSDDATARLWNLQADTLKTFVSPKVVGSVAFSTDGNILTTSGDSAFVWNKDYTPEGKLGHSSTVQSVVFSPDGSKILSGSDDSTARIWDLHGKEIIKFKHPNGIVAVTFSPGGSRILTGSRDSTAKLWHSNDSIHSTIFKHSGIVYSVAFSPDSSTILTGSADSTAKLWRLSDNKEIHTFRHSNTVESVAFSPDGKEILTGSHDQTACLWSINDWTLLKTFKIPAQVRSVAFSPDGKKIFIGAADGIGRLVSSITLDDFLKSDETDTLTDEQKQQFEIIK